MNLKDAFVKRMMYRFGTGVKSKHLAALLTRSSWRKLVNLVRVEWGIRRGKTHGFGYPYVLTVEPTNVCNLRCTLCPTGQGNVGRRRQSMPLDRFKACLDDVLAYVYVINFQNWGEPTIARELCPLIRYAHDRRVFTCMATNGNYAVDLNDRLIDAHLDHVTFSMDGTTQAVYERYRRGGDLDQVRTNVTELIRRKRQRRVKHPFVEVQFLVFDHNRHQVDAFRRAAKDLGADGAIVRAGEGPGNDANIDRYYTWDNKRGFCRRFWYTATVASDGGVVPCCNYFDSRHDFGNASEAGFAAVWSNDDYRRNRSVVAERRLADLHDVCRSCRVYDDRMNHYPIWDERPVE